MFSRTTFTSMGSKFPFEAIFNRSIVLDAAFDYDNASSCIILNTA